MTNHFINLVGVGAAQMPGTELVFLEIIKDFDLIIEIGTDNGGLALWLYLNKRADAAFYTYEKEPTHVKIPKNHEINSHIVYCDCLTEDTIDSISALIKSSGKTLFLCDGGAKIIEFGVFSKFLKYGDVIVLHDFADSPNETQNYADAKAKLLKDGLWDGCGFEVHEASYNSIEDDVISAGLVKYNYNKFLGVLWGCFIKL